MKKPFLKNLRFFRPLERYAEELSELSPRDREWEKLYHRRWQFDKIVRTTHGVNCTGACSWKVFVKDGIVTWETQQTDYPSTGPDLPEFEPRGCPRGASFSWYLYSPLRVKYPYVRGTLLNFWREALEKSQNDPVAAWASIVESPEKANQYKRARGRGGLIRATWDEVYQLISAAMIYTLKTYGPDRIAGISPIPAMSMVSYAGGSRFLSLVGAPMMSFYDWYADLPPASPQIWGEQTDVPESSDWYNSGYLIIWGSNLPQTRTPDAHFMTEARYRGTKVVSVSPDYAEYCKFADNWLAVKPGSDGALAQAMTHVILNEFYVKQETPYFNQYAKRYTDLPYLIMLKKNGNSLVPDRFLKASDLGPPFQNAEWKPVVLDKNTLQTVIPHGSIGHRWDGLGKWNLHQKDENETPYDPALTLLGVGDDKVSITLPYFDDQTRDVLHRTVPVKKIGLANNTTCYVTTVYDLMLANYGISRGLGGDYPKDYNDPKPYTPAWQETFTGVDSKLVIQIAKEFAQNAIDTQGRSMIIMGAGINQWYNSDVTYRSILNLVLLTGSEGVNGGGWAHYVGQEKCYPYEGWQTVAFARDWSLPPRLQNATSYYYFATEQWRYDELKMDDLSSPIQPARYHHTADYNVLAARLGWLPSYPQFDKNSLNLFDEAKQHGANTPEKVGNYLAHELRTGNLRFAIEDPGNPQNFPRIFFIWRSNLLTSSGKGHEYFLKHLLGTANGLLAEENPGFRPTEIVWRDKAPEGKLDLLVNLDFKTGNTALYSDIVLPAATWYEKYDLNSTDMHPFIHPLNPAVSPLWESKPDWDIFKDLAYEFSQMATKYFSEPVNDIVTSPLLHDSPDEIAQPSGRVLDWKKGEVEAIPGKTLPKINIVERDYTEVYEKFVALGPLLQDKPIGVHGFSYSASEQFELLKKLNGVIKGEGLNRGLPDISTDRNACEAILTLSSCSNGKVALKAWEAEGKKTGLVLTDLAKERAEERISFFDIITQPKQIISTPAFSGLTTRDRRYSPFTMNIEHLVPFRTLTGRQHFYLDHEILIEYGESLPVYKPPLTKNPFYQEGERPETKGKELTLRYLTPHGKWNIHTTYQDNTFMLTLFRGGPNVWLNNQDAADGEIQDNDWVEVYNRNGVVVARAVVSHRIPRGMMYMYHAQDSHINVPGSPITHERGGPHNSPTRIHMKPTQMIGGYAQLSYGFNYYGPIGSQRDTYVVIRKLKEVTWLEN